jgi:16S rRNA (guanine1207-N2)-methyltransferase
VSDHYYSKNPTSESNPNKISINLRGAKFSFNTDAGVFSKNDIDFGSKLLIEVLEVGGSERKVLDVGCGYGPIGLNIARILPNATVHMVDVNERAIQLSMANAIENSITNTVIYESYLLENIESGVAFDLIVSNPPIRAGKQVIFNLYEQAHQKLNPGGSLWIVIQKKQGAESTIDKLESIFDEVEVIEKKKGYYIIKSKKY